MLYCNLQALYYVQCSDKYFAPEIWLLEGPWAWMKFSMLAIACHILCPSYKSTIGWNKNSLCLNRIRAKPHVDIRPSSHQSRYDEFQQTYMPIRPDELQAFFVELRQSLKTCPIIHRLFKDWKYNTPCPEKKRPLYTFACNFVKCWAIFKIPGRLLLPSTTVISKCADLGLVLLWRRCITIGPRPTSGSVTTSFFHIMKHSDYHW